MEMEGNMVISPAEINSMAYLNKKRKLQAEPQGMPLPKHVCWGHHRLEYDSSSDLSVFAKGCEESDQESAKDSCSFHGDADSDMSPCDVAKPYPKMDSSVGTFTSSASWDGSSSGIGLYSLESRSVAKASSSKSEQLSICVEIESLNHDNYEDHLLEFGGFPGCSYSENQNDVTEKDLEDLLYSNGVDPSNYVLSSGKCSVNQDTQPITRKPTIDKEFEDYFSALML